MNVRSIVEAIYRPLNIIPACHCVLLLFICAPAWGSEKSVVYLNSYHAGYDWSDKEFNAFKIQLSDDPIKIHHFYMNTKYIRDPADIAAIVKKALKYIDKHQPDILVAADDNASKYIVEPHFKNSDIPVVYLGINLDAAAYGYPYKNSTGMVELEGLKNLIDVIRQYTQYNKVTMIFTQTTTSLKKYQHYRQQIANLNGVVVKSLAEFKAAVKALQGSHQLLALDTLNGMDNYDPELIKSFLASQHGQPVISVSNSSQDMAHFGYIKVPDEHGIWAGEAVQKILSGVKVSDIPPTNNSHYQVFINQEFAKQCQVIIPPVFYQLPFIHVND